MRSCSWILAGVLLSGLFPGAQIQAEEEYFGPAGILLTWKRDPATTMTIDWHTKPGDHETRPASILYRKAGTDDEWRDIPGRMHPFPYTSRTVNRAELTGLEPDTLYSFRFGPAPERRFPFTESRTYHFRTMPTSLEQRPVLAAFGGDTGTYSNTELILEQLGKYDIDFLVIGGDLAYADGGGRDWRNNQHSHPGRSKQWWERWFDIFTEKMITEEERVIPVIAGIGNHEVWAGYYTNRAHSGYEQTDAWRERIAPIYYNIFAFPGQPGYAKLDFSDYLSLVMLDTDHTNPVDGVQTEWLGQVLSERTQVPHDKRTFPILGGEIHPDGVVYIGDGALGMGSHSTERLRSVDDNWYLKKVLPGFHFILAELTPEGRQLTVVNEEGEVIDTY